MDFENLTLAVIPGRSILIGQKLVKNTKIEPVNFEFDPFSRTSLYLSRCHTFFRPSIQIPKKKGDFLHKKAFFWQIPNPCHQSRK